MTRTTTIVKKRLHYYKGAEGIRLTDQLDEEDSNVRGNMATSTTSVAAKSRRMRLQHHSPIRRPIKTNIGEGGRGGLKSGGGGSELTVDAQQRNMEKMSVHADGEEGSASTSLVKDAVGSRAVDATERESKISNTSGGVENGNSTSAGMMTLSERRRAVRQRQRQQMFRSSPRAGTSQPSSPTKVDLIRSSRESNNTMNVGPAEEEIKRREGKVSRIIAELSNHINDSYEDKATSPRKKTSFSHGGSVKSSPLQSNNDSREEVSPSYATAPSSPTSPGGSLRRRAEAAVASQEKVTKKAWVSSSSGQSNRGGGSVSGRLRRIREVSSQSQSPLGRRHRTSVSPERWRGDDFSSRERTPLADGQQEQQQHRHKTHGRDGNSGSKEGVNSDGGDTLTLSSVNPAVSARSRLSSPVPLQRHIERAWESGVGEASNHGTAKSSQINNIKPVPPAPDRAGSNGGDGGATPKSSQLSPHFQNSPNGQRRFVHTLSAESDDITYRSSRTSSSDDRRRAGTVEVREERSDSISIETTKGGKPQRDSQAIGESATTASRTAMSRSFRMQQLNHLRYGSGGGNRANMVLQEREEDEGDHQIDQTSDDRALTSTSTQSRSINEGVDAELLPPPPGASPTTTSTRGSAARSMTSGSSPFSPSSAKSPTSPRRRSVDEDAIGTVIRPANKKERYDSYVMRRHARFSDGYMPQVEKNQPDSDQPGGNSLLRETHRHRMQLQIPQQQLGNDGVPPFSPPSYFPSSSTSPRSDGHHSMQEQPPEHHDNFQHHQSPPQHHHERQSRGLSSFPSSPTEDVSGSGIDTSPFRSHISFAPSSRSDEPISPRGSRAATLRADGRHRVVGGRGGGSDGLRGLSIDEDDQTQFNSVVTNNQTMNTDSVFTNDDMTQTGVREVIAAGVAAVSGSPTSPHTGVGASDIGAIIRGGDGTDRMTDGMVSGGSGPLSPRGGHGNAAAPVPVDGETTALASRGSGIDHSPPAAIASIPEQPATRMEMADHVRRLSSSGRGGLRGGGSVASTAENSSASSRQRAATAMDGGSVAGPILRKPSSMSSYDSENDNSTAILYVGADDGSWMGSSVARKRRMRSGGGGGAASAARASPSASSMGRYMPPGSGQGALHGRSDTQYAEYDEDFYGYGRRGGSRGPRSPRSPRKGRGKEADVADAVDNFIEERRGRSGSWTGEPGRRGEADNTGYRTAAGVAVAAALGAIVFGPVGVLVGAASVGIGIGVMQIPEEQRRHVGDRATAALRQAHETAH